MWYDPKQAFQIQATPWLSSEAISELEKIIQPDFEVIEFGGGGSTLWFAERVKQVYCYETNLDWFNAISNSGTSNVSMRFSVFPLPDMDARKDLLLIDGEPVEHRAVWLLESQRMVKSGGWIVLDNANRPEYAKEREQLKQFAELIYTSPLYGSYLITEFWRVL